MGEQPRWVWEDPPCLTYIEARTHLGTWRGGCLYHQTKGPDRVSEDEAQADCTKHLQVEWQKAQQLPI